MNEGMFFDGVNLKSAGLPLANLWENTGLDTTVGTLLERKSDSICVYFYVNGHCLGCGFKLTEPKFLKKYWYPCIISEESQQVHFSFAEVIPTARMREQPIFPGDPYEGKEL